MTKAPAKSGEQLLHLVFGGELDDVKAITFKDLSKLDVVGFYPNYAEAYKAWKGAAQLASAAIVLLCLLPWLWRHLFRKSAPEKSATSVHDRR